VLCLQQDVYTVLVFVFDNLLSQGKTHNHGFHVILAACWVLLDFLKAFSYFRESELAVKEVSQRARANANFAI